MTSNEPSGRTQSPLGRSTDAKNADGYVVNCGQNPAKAVTKSFCTCSTRNAVLSAIKIRDPVTSTAVGSSIKYCSLAAASTAPVVPAPTNVVNAAVVSANRSTRFCPADEINNAFWQACSGGQRRAAELLLAHGADLNWVPDYAKGTPLDQASNIDTGRAALVSWLKERGARSALG